MIWPTHITRIRQFDRDAGVPGQEGITPIPEAQNFTIGICGHDIYPWYFIYPPSLPCLMVCSSEFPMLLNAWFRRVIMVLGLSFPTTMNIKWSDRRKQSLITSTCTKWPVNTYEVWWLYSIYSVDLLISFPDLFSVRNHRSMWVWGVYAFQKSSGNISSSIIASGPK